MDTGRWGKRRHIARKKKEISKYFFLPVSIVYG